MSKYTKLASNSIMFAIGNLGSKLIYFFLLPLYTYTMTTTQYGSADVIQTTINLLIPVVSLNIFDGVLRYAMDKTKNPSEILRIGNQITVIGGVLTLIIAISLQLFGIHLILLIASILILQSFQSLYSQYLKAIGKVRLFAYNGILLTFVTALADVILLWGFRLGLVGYLVAIAVSTLISNLYLILVGRIQTSLSLKKLFTFNKDLTGELVRYSVPLIPNSIAWWSTSAISRYFITFFLSVSANGIFAVANRIPSMLNVFNTIFFQSWQLSAIEEYDSSSTETFYGNVFQMYSEMMILLTSGLICVLKPLMVVIVSKSFFVAWKYIPILLISIIFSSYSSFFGQLYIAAKRTTGVFSTTIIAAIINVAGSIALIPRLGLYGAASASLVSYLILWVLRIWQTSKFIKINPNWGMIVIGTLILVLQILRLYLANVIMDLLLIPFTLAIAFAYRQLLLRFAGLILKRFRK